MTGRLAAIWRHPIKGHGREALTRVGLAEGSTLPWDRVWAVAHENSKAEGGQWSPCVNFSRGAKAPQLMAITASFDEAEERITLRHPERAPLSFRPDRDADAFLEWIAPLMPADRAKSAAIIRAGEHGLTNSPFPSISIGSLDTLAALESAIGAELSPDRFRANLRIEGFDPWEEFSWVGRTLRIGGVELRVEQRITRCLATATNPATGERDADTLGTLEKNWGHRDFGIYAVVTKGGEIALDDPVDPA